MKPGSTDFIRGLGVAFFASSSLLALSGCAQLSEGQTQTTSVAASNAGTGAASSIVLFMGDGMGVSTAVSYTHLTLPTILLV